MLSIIKFNLFLQQVQSAVSFPANVATSEDCKACIRKILAPLKSRYTMEALKNDTWINSKHSDKVESSLISSRPTSAPSRNFSSRWNSLNLSWNKHFEGQKKVFLILGTCYFTVSHTLQALDYPLTFYTNMPIINLLLQWIGTTNGFDKSSPNDKVSCFWCKSSSWLLILRFCSFSFWTECLANVTENYLMVPMWVEKAYTTTPMSHTSAINHFFNCPTHAKLSLRYALDDPVKALTRRYFWQEFAHRKAFRMNTSQFRSHGSQSITLISCTADKPLSFLPTW